MGISSSATFRVTSPDKKIVQTCLLNLVTPFLTLMLTLLKDLSISTNGLAILMLFFLAILLTTPQFAPPNWDESKNWFADIKAYNKLDSFDYPIIADPNRTIANTYGMMDPDELDSKGMPLTCRAVFIIGPDKKLKLSILYPATTGRNFDEVLRVIDSL